MVSVQIKFLNDKPGSFEYAEVDGPKLAVARVPCAEEEIVFSGKLHRVMFVRHLAEAIPLMERSRDEWPPRAEIGVIPA